MRQVYIYDIKKRWAFVLATILIALTHLYAILPGSGATMAHVLEAHPTFITPAGYAYAIWAVILFTLLVFAYFQLTRGKELRFYRLVWPYFIVGAVSHVFWVLAFQSELFGLALVFIACLAVSLAVMQRLYYRLKRTMNTTHRYFFKVPFSMYFAWVSILVPVNLFIFLSEIDSGLFARFESLFAIASLAAVAIYAGMVLIRRSDYVYPLAVVWIYVAIWVVGPESAGSLHTAKFSAILLAALMLVIFVKDRVEVARYGKSRLKTTS